MSSGLWGLVLLAVLALAYVVTAERRRPRMDERARAAAPGHFAALSDGLTHCQWHGPSRGPVVVLIHGLTTPSFVWAGLIPGLVTAGYRVLSYDLFGRGFSDRPSAPQDRAFFIRQLTELLAAEEDVPESVTLVGYSMGGAIATVFAEEHPERVDRLVLIAPAGLGHDLGWFLNYVARAGRWGDVLITALGGIMHRRNLRTAASGPDLPDMVSRQAAEANWRGFFPSVQASMRGILSEDLTADQQRLGQTRLPVLAIWGEQDTIIDLHGLGRMSKANRNTRHVVLKDAGHDLAYTRAPEVLEAITAFLRED